MIKIDMDLPKSCGQCELVTTNGYSPQEPLVCSYLRDKNVDFYELEQEGRHPDCPLIEIKEIDNGSQV